MSWGEVGLIIATILGAILPLYIVSRQRHNQNIDTWNRVIQGLEEHGLHSHRECNGSRFGDKIPLTTDGIVTMQNFRKDDDD